ncbi:Fc receptor-like protein 4 isoform X2 [Stegastes partitus]|uniref:Fc receptor-like protein 4 isoform X2 n=1 Tax=Stegastes partitus TaxID=144197 RepID=A0A9Y4NJN8_9TELE|nr:PREDICTED: Fc receptor-like protein 4 isoform X2 [Stegastes partitus]XP_008298541.1 PREDICTED: Fc receptor-like protein 4 isoform X2 [Stegastes partitus]
MRTILLLLLLMRCCRTATDARASVVVEPNQAQFFEYQHFSLSCEQFGAGGWTVWRYTTKGLVLSQCGSAWGSQKSSTCHMDAVKASNTGVYWCQSKYRDSSDGVNITITDKSVILQSPAMPVTEGGNITLRCMTKERSDLQAQFYQNGAVIGSGPAGHMTIHHVSKNHEGAYKCSIKDRGESPLSWLLVEDGSDSASLTVSPDSSQMFEYQHLSLNCGEKSSFHGWTVHRSKTSVSNISRCGDWGDVSASGCSLPTTKQKDSGLYWCESPARRRSNLVNLTVHDKSVILESPVLPVMKGDNVTLRCRSRHPTSLPAAFYKDGAPIRTEPAGHITLYSVSKSDEGLYKCHIGSLGESPSSRLLVRGPDEAAPAPEALSVLRVICYMVVCCPYVISTVLMVSLYRRRPSESDAARRRNLPVSMATSSPGEEDEAPSEQYDDVIAAVTTEHHF